MASFPPLSSTTTVFDELASRHTRRIFCFQVDGLVYRYYSGAAPPTTTIGGGVLGNYTDIQAITHVGNLSGNLDPAGGIAEFSPITITLQGGHRRELSDGDPTKVFSRLGRRSATDWAQVITTLEQDNTSPATLEVDRDPSGWAGIAGAIHVGAETMYASATGGTGTDVDPYTITVTRAVADTKPQAHVVDAETGINPEVVTEIVHWRTRRAVLYMANERPDGSTSDYIEVMRGIIDSTPEVDGNTVTINLVPLSALLDEEVATERRKFRMVQGFHHFYAPWACVLQHVQSMPRGAGFTERVDQVSAAAGGRVYVESTEAFEQNYDTSLDDGHPRHGAIEVHGESDPIGVDSVTSGDRFNVPGTMPVGALPVGARVVNAGSAEAHQVAVTSDVELGTEETLRWPEDILSDVNSASGWAPGSTQGVDGQWLDVRIVQGGEVGPHLRIEGNGDADFGANLLVKSASARHVDGDADDAQYWEDALAAVFGFGLPTVSGHSLLWYGIDMAAPEDDRTDGPGQGGWNRLVVVPFGREQRVPIRGIASAFYQTGEEYILLDGDVPIGSSGETDIEIRYTDHVTGEEQTHVATITSSGAVTYDGATVGYKCRLKQATRQRTPSFGDWPGLPRVVVVPHVQFRAVPPSTVMLRLLLSGGGQGINDATYDVLPVGLNLDSGDVDIESFRSLAAPPLLDLWTFKIEDGDKLRDILDPLLKTLQANIVMRRDEKGRCRVTLMRSGLESKLEAVGSIANGEWATMPLPMSTADDKIVNQYTLKTNHDESGEEKLTVIVNDRRSQATYQEVKEEELDLRGVRLPASNEVEPLLRNFYAGLFFMLGDPRRVWRGRVSTGKATLAELGAVYTVSSDHLRAYGDAGITSEAGRVISVDVGLWPTEEGATLEFVHHGVNATGWNASGWVESWPTATTVTISANAFSATEDPHTGAAQKDVDAFAAGDVVEWVTEADHDTVKGPLTIDSITRSTNTITFTGNHGITATGFLQPVEYDSASAGHALLAYLADASDNLGASNDDGQDIV